ncbi:glycoside hydrolase family 16 protein [Moniliophthora roreri MCA 2997]|uniref:Glycoside hydrolase family 16 protein n=1 Tax=Moniliophthora roreri (strain MCA 2997) TaxID=1381753 RepID=V2XE67_MONRO|nr:glycoside hydrolase family 16 protein [Moniliophthora roreri MCA 2997]KAI3616759.1 glycoside hydrolase family 16 protein [Moniliophthora roreri]
MATSSPNSPGYPHPNDSQSQSLMSSRARSTSASRSSSPFRNNAPTGGNINLPPNLQGPPPSSMLNTKGSMVLYRLAAEEELRPPFSNRSSAASNYSDTHGLLPPRNDSSRSSIHSFSYGDVDHKYPIPHHHTQTSSHPSSPAASPHLGPRAVLNSPSVVSSLPGAGSAPRGIVPYVYDPATDSHLPDDEEDVLHDPKATPDTWKKLFAPGHLLNKKGGGSDQHWLSWRGFFNIGALALLLVGLVVLFLGYPVISDVVNRSRNALIEGNIRVNATGQVPILNGARPLVDPDTPDDVKTRTGFDGQVYDLVFSDEFERPGRTFYPGDDPFFEAVDIWYGVTNDLEWYDPQQAMTRDGALVITMDSADTLTPLLTPGSTAPFTRAQNHNLTYRSAMLQSWNKLCFSSGYIEVSVKLPAPGNTANGYWPGAWTMGNLGRAGYMATTDGMWPYSYDSCDIGTFPNQTTKDGIGAPAGVTLPDGIWPQYNSQISVLNGQRLSSCTCQNEDHPGPYGKIDSGAQRYRGRGAPEIDIIEIQHERGLHLASQSVQFAPFTHEYQIDNSPQFYQIYNRSITDPNPYTGSPLQQAVSSQTVVPDDGFDIPGGRYVTYGFEYWADPNDRDNGFITWQLDGKQTVTMRPGSVGPDKGPEGTQIDQRIIPEEPMYAILNMGISHNWAGDALDISSLQFPAEMKFDYIRIYQRQGHTNVGCDPPDYPTSQYIKDHQDQYTNRELTAFNYAKYGRPKNRLYDGC